MKWRACLAAIACSLIVSGCGGASGPETGNAAAQSNDASATTTGSGSNPVTPASGATRPMTPVVPATNQPANPTDPDTGPSPVTPKEPTAPQPTSRIDASRLLQQATFGPNTTLVDQVSASGARAFVVDQFAKPVSRYSYTLPTNRYRQEIHTKGLQDFCDQFEQGSAQHDNCWRDWKSPLPVQWDFYRQAVSGEDQLRQRVAFSLSQIFVTSASKIEGSYALAHYQQMLRDNAFGNYRTLLRKVTLSPYMGRYLDMVDNSGDDPNENYAREMLQLFSLGTCLLNPDGSMQSGACVATYNNELVRNYAYALSGWTYPAGGINPWCDDCNEWTNPEYYRGDMVAVAAQHDNKSRQLLSGLAVPAGRTPQQALDAVVASVMSHQNLAPFISRQLIQFLVTSNPSPAYVARVSNAFSSGTYSDSVGNIGSGERGDMQATIAAILLDAEARSATQAGSPDFGRLREPALYVAGAVRALDGKSDGIKLGEWGNWGIRMGQDPFNAPSVFNFYPPNFPLTGTNLVAPQFGINNTNTVLARINFANALVYWWYERGQGVPPNDSVAGSTGTQVSYQRFENTLVNPATDSVKVAQQLNDLLADGRIPMAQLQQIAQAMSVWSDEQTSWLTNDDHRSSWQREQVKTAVYLILSSPHYQVQR